MRICEFTRCPKDEGGLTVAIKERDYLAKARTLAERLGRSKNGDSPGPKGADTRTQEPPRSSDPSKNGHKRRTKKPKRAKLDSRAGANNTHEASSEDYLDANAALAETHNLIYRDEDLDAVVRWLATCEEVAVDIETYGTAKTKDIHKKEALSFVRGRVRLIQLCSGDETYLLDAMFLSRDALARVLEELRGKPLYCHNGIFDIPRLKRLCGVDLAGEDVRDTMVLSRLVRNGRWEWKGKEGGGIYPAPYRHNIGDILARELGIEIPNEVDHRWGEPLNEDRIRYAVDDVRHLKELYGKLLEYVEEDGLQEGLDLIRSVYPAYMGMQARGVPFDKKLFEDLQKQLKNRVGELFAELEEHAPEHPEGLKWSWRNLQKVDENDPSMGSGKTGALRALSLVGVVLPDMKKHTRIGYLRDHKAPLLKYIHEYLKYATLQSNTQDWVKYSYEDGRIYPNVKFFSQETGRTAYELPPLQNFPKDDEDISLMASFRDCIRAREGHRVIKCDYSSQELRILAYVTGDEALIKALTSVAEEGKDPHLIVGEKIAGKPLKRGTEEGEKYRKMGKRANYGFAYGAGAKRYAQSVYEDTAEPISIEQAKAEQEAFRAAWPDVYKWQQEFGPRDGKDPEDWFTESFTGRRRYVGERDGTPNYCDRLNGPIQSNGADMLYKAVAKLCEADGYPGVNLLFTTHDEIVAEVPADDADLVLAWLSGRMEDAAEELLGGELATDNCVEGEEGPSWGGG